MRIVRYPVTFACCLVICLAFATAAEAATLKDNPATIFYSAGHYLAGQAIRPGYDVFGYNYQAHMFNGSYANTYLGRDGLPPYEGDDAAYYDRLVAEELAVDVADAQALVAAKWYWPWRDTNLTMKWNDAWISNQDRGDDAGGTTPDDKLDRHYGYPTYTNSGAWLTNHMSGSYTVLVNGKEKKAHWTYFVKIVTPSDADQLIGSVWFNEEVIEIGPAIWGAFAIVQQVENDPFLGVHGKQYGSPAGPGFGQYGPED